jgi:hypothetical protein
VNFLLASSRASSLPVFGVAINAFEKLKIKWMKLLKAFQKIINSPNIG